jgi:two-component system response regulator HydG
MSMTLTFENLSSSLFPQIVGRSAGMKGLFGLMERVAPTDVSVHIYGENGTGKELVAEALHRHSKRSGAKLVRLNCSALPHALLESALFGYTRGAFTGAVRPQGGFLEHAEGGTLFLDEVGEISQDVQVKLLRLLQSNEYYRLGESTPRQANVRVITATNRDLHQLMRQGRIREDFFYRVNVFPLTIPPLRERGEDVVELAEYFRRESCPTFCKQVPGFTEEALSAIRAYSWPGNVRQLENAIKRAFVLITDGVIGIEHLPPEILPIRAGGERCQILVEAHQQSERQQIVAALERAGGNRTRAAQMLGYSRVTLWKKLGQFGIEFKPT